MAGVNSVNSVEKVPLRIGMSYHWIALALKEAPVSRLRIVLALAQPAHEDVGDSLAIVCWLADVGETVVDAVDGNHVGFRVCGSHR